MSTNYIRKRDVYTEQALGIQIPYMLISYIKCDPRQDKDHKQDRGGQCNVNVLICNPDTQSKTIDFKFKLDI